MLAGYLLQLSFHQLPDVVNPSHGFYCYLVLSLLILLTLVLFIMHSCQALQGAGKEQTCQYLAKEHYERYFDQEEDYIREVVDRYHP